MVYWFWFCVILVPVLVFSVKPDASRRVRAWRLLAALFVCYVMTLVRVFGWEVIYSYGWVSYDVYESHRGLELKQTLHWIIFGWAWSCAYIGFWEWLWQKKYAKQLLLMDGREVDVRASRVIRCIGYRMFWSVGLLLLLAIVSTILSRV
jgi:hypothetical protein